MILGFFFLFLYGDSFPYPCESLGGASEDREWRGCWKRMEHGLCFGLFPCHRPSLSLRGSWPEQPDLPQVAMDMEIRSKIEHKMVFMAFSFPLKKEGFLSVSFHSFLAPGRNGLFCICLKYTKHSFLVKSATGGKQSSIA